MNGKGDMKVTTYEISPKCTLVRGHIGEKPGSKWVKTCPSLNKTRYKCYFEGIGHMRCGKDVKVTFFYVSPKFTWFWGLIGGTIGGQKG